MTLYNCCCGRGFDSLRLHQIGDNMDNKEDEICDSCGCDPCDCGWGNYLEIKEDHDP